MNANQSARGNPGGWPTGPLECRSYYDRRDVANATADMGEAIREALLPLVDWLSRQLLRIGKRRP